MKIYNRKTKSLIEDIRIITISLESNQATISTKEDLELPYPKVYNLDDLEIRMALEKEQPIIEENRKYIHKKTKQIVNVIANHYLPRYSIFPAKIEGRGLVTFKEFKKFCEDHKGLEEYGEIKQFY